MERIHHLVNADGLQIPLPLMERYGFQPGMNAVIEMGEGDIRIIAAAPSLEEIENRVLRLLLHRLGDAVTVRSKLVEEGAQSHWDVYIGAQGTDAILGVLRYSIAGELLTDLNSEVQQILRNAHKVASQE